MVRGRGCSFPRVSRIVGTPATCGGADASRPGNGSIIPLDSSSVRLSLYRRNSRASFRRHIRDY